LKLSSDSRMKRVHTNWKSYCTSHLGRDSAEFIGEKIDMKVGEQLGKVFCAGGFLRN
jgi:hypothetical protein